eukprot:5037681-Pyramimonas_sp.AAC.1
MSAAEQKEWASHQRLPKGLWEAFVAMRTTILRAGDDAASDAGSDASFGDAGGAGNEELRGWRKRGQEQVLTPEEQERMESPIRDRVRARTSKRLRTTKGQ